MAIVDTSYTSKVGTEEIFENLFRVFEINLGVKRTSYTFIVQRYPMV